MHNGRLTKYLLSTVVNGVTYTREYYCSLRSMVGFNDDIHNEWVAKDVATQYVKRDEVKIDAIKRIFKLHADTATDEHPLERPDLWTDMGGVNSVKAFDNILNSQAVANQNVTIELDFNRSNTLALLNIDGINSITVEQISNTDDSIRREETIYTTRKYAGKTPHAVFFKPIRRKRVLLIQGLEWHPDSRVIIKITYGNEPIKIGTIATTMLENIAITLYGSSVGFDNDSTRVEDNFGGITFNEREVTDILNAKVIIDTDDTTDAFYTLKSRAKEMSLWVGDARDKGLEIMTMIGYPQSTTFQIDNPSMTEFPITIIGDSNAN